MIRRIARGLARRILKRSPRIPSAAPSGRQPPTRPTERPPEKPEEAPEEEELPELEVEAAEVARWIAEGRPVLLLDIREPYELRQGHAEHALLIPMNDVPQRLGELPRDRAIAVYCAAGVRSFGVAGWLREQGFEQAWSVAGGIGDLAAVGIPTVTPGRG